LPDLVRGWKSAHPVHFDIGVAKGPWGSEHFIEGFGIGLFAETMSKLDDKLGDLDPPSSNNPKNAVPAAVKMLNEQLKKFDAKDMVVRLDGKDVSGNYLLLEAMNIRYIGPNLDLVPRAEINDGLFDVVFVTGSQRAKLKNYLAGRASRKNLRAKLTVRRGQHLQIEWQNSPIHIDDMTWPKRKDRTPLRSNIIDIRVNPAALVFLTPKLV
jgi:diacylglycerol kinase (ATP)